MNARLDLHCHSTASDGRYPAEEVLARALASNLDVLALTDHDLAPVLPWGPVPRPDGPPLRLVHGAEVTGAHDGAEYHLLVYFPGPMPEGFASFCRRRAQFRAERFNLSCARLGLLDRAPPEAVAGDRALTRHHLATALMAAPGPDGAARTWMDCYTLLKDPAVVPLCDLAFVDAIREARAAGGLTSWAHPPLDAARRHVATFAAAGLQALEGVRPRTDKPTRNGLKRLAAKHKLLLTGGSDWHGWTPDFGHFALSGEHAERWLARLDAA